MKKLFGLLLCTFLFSLSYSQVRDADPQLNKHLETYFALNKQLDFEKIMDYMHPKLFKIAPREAIIASFKQSFYNEEMEIGIDSITTVAIGKSFIHKGTEYKKIDYYMGLQLKFMDTSIYSDPEFITTMVSSFKTSFEGKNVGFDEKARSFFVRGNDFMFGIKESAGKEWKFLGYQKNEALIKQLYDKEVIDHFKLL